MFDYENNAKYKQLVDITRRAQQLYQLVAVWGNSEKLDTYFRISTDDGYNGANLDFDALGVDEAQVRTAMKLQFAVLTEELKALVSDINDDIER